LLRVGPWHLRPPSFKLQASSLKSSSQTRDHPLFPTPPPLFPRLAGLAAGEAACRLSRRAFPLEAPKTLLAARLGLAHDAALAQVGFFAPSPSSLPLPFVLS
jgi:hypothetical protein